LIAEGSKRVESLRADLDVAESLLELAKHIDEDCKIEIAVAE
jgi:hypothetical protein